MSMTREALLAMFQKSADLALKPKAVEIKGWGTVYVRAMTVAEVDEQSSDEEKDKSKAGLARGAARLLCDETGKRLFKADDETAVALLAAQPWTLLRQILQASDDDIKGEPDTKK